MNSEHLMEGLILKKFTAGILAVNCYLVYDSRDRRGFLVDLPSPADLITEYIERERIVIDYVLLTHAHFDHIGGLRYCRTPFYLQADDQRYLTDSRLNGSELFSESVVVDRPGLLYPETGLAFKEWTIDVIRTPGHTPGSVSLRLGKWLFTGDTLFFHSIGRTDLPFSSGEAIFSSIREKLFSLDDSLIVYPGHGPSSTIGREKRENPFV